MDKMPGFWRLEASAKGGIISWRQTFSSPDARNQAYSKPTWKTIGTEQTRLGYITLTPQLHSLLPIYVNLK